MQRRNFLLNASAQSSRRFRINAFSAQTTAWEWRLSQRAARARGDEGVLTTGRAELRCVADVYDVQRGRARDFLGVKPDEVVAIEEALSRKDVDAVLIGSPDHLHLTQMLAACDAIAIVSSQKIVVGCWLSRLAKNQPPTSNHQPPCGLVLQPQRELPLTRSRRLQHAGDAACDARAIHARAVAADPRVGEIDAVGEVERLGAELHFDSFGDLEVLEEGHVQIRESRAFQPIAAYVAEGAGGGALPWTIRRTGGAEDYRWVAGIRRRAVLQRSRSGAEPLIARRIIHPPITH